MRITNSMLVNRFVGNLSSNLNKLSKLQTQLAGNKKYAHISDDPISVVYALQARYKLARLDDYRNNVQVTREWNASAESAVTDINTIIQDAYAACVDASTDGKTDEDRSLIAANIAELRDSLLTSLNAVFGNKFMFGGYNTTGYPGNGSTVAPFTVDTNGNLLYNSQIISAREFSYETSTAGSTVANWAVNVTDNDKLQFALGSSKSFNMEFRDDGGGGIIFSLGSQEIVVKSPDELRNTLGSTLSFDELGLDIVLSDAQIDELAAMLSGSGNAADTYWGVAPVSQQVANPNPSSLDPGDQYMTFVTYELPEVLKNLGSRNEIFFTNELLPADEDLFNRLLSDNLSFDVGPGISMRAALNGIELAIYDENGNNLYELLDDLHTAMTDGTEAKDLSLFIAKLQSAQGHVLALTAELGGRQNRLDMLEARYDLDELNYYTMLSNAEDADEAELIMREKMAESVYQAALQTGAYIIQPTLMDFLK